MTRFTASILLGSGLLALNVPGMAQSSNDQHWNMIDQYCMDCHDYEGFAGGIAFDLMDPAHVSEEAEVWEKVIRKLRGGMMPPPGQDQPQRQQAWAVVEWLEDTIDTAAADQGHVGEVVLHRLNRREYEIAVKDLLGIDFDATFLLPKDDISDGFDNIANVLQVSPSFIDQYLNAARQLSNQALGDPLLRQRTTTLRGEPGQDQGSHVPGLPLGTRGGLLVEHDFPADGEYVFDLNVSAMNEEHPHDVLFFVDGEEIFRTTIGGAEEARMLDQQGIEARRAIQGRFSDIRLALSAGTHSIGLTFIARGFRESEDLLYSYRGGSISGANAGSVRVTGPFNATTLGASPSRDRIFTCYPASVEEESACAAEIIEQLASKAFRRPVSDQDLAGPMAFYQAAREQENFEAGIQNALMSILASPHFLYRIESAPEGTSSGQEYALNGLALASRLSFFLWSSVPDEELLALGSSGDILKNEVLEQQVDRMLADPRAEALVTNFAYQWLDVDKLEEADPDPSLFPAYDFSLTQAFREEMRLFVGSILLEDRPVTELLSASHTFLNERLARHYQVSDVLGNRFRRVELEDENRWGLLGKGSILTATSYPDRTAPVLRGAWILERITGTPPNAPPPDVEALKETGENGEALTVRDRMIQHRADPSCNGCHGVMDPLGLALENFDAIGAWQEFDRFARADIDASGELPDGTALNSPEDLRKALLQNPEQFVQTLTEKLMTYGLSRTVEYEDMPRIRQIVHDAEAEDYRLSALIKGIVTSTQFRMNEMSSEAEAIASRSE